MTNNKLSDDKTKCDPPTTVKIVQAQPQDTFCCTAAAQVRQSNYKFTVNQENQLVCKEHISDRIRILLLSFLRQRILMMPHYSPFAGHFSQRSVYDTPKQIFFSPDLAADIYFTVNYCKSCARNKPKHCDKRIFHLFPASRLLEFDGRDIVSPAPKFEQKQSVHSFYSRTLLKANAGSPDTENFSHARCKCVHESLVHPIRQTYPIRHPTVPVDRQPNSIRKQA